MAIRKLFHRKFTNVDLISSMKEILDIHTQAYKSDFDYDVALMEKYVCSSDKKDKTLYWLCRKLGTWLFTLEDAYTNDSFANHAVLNYFPDDGSNILLYGITIHSGNSESILGTLHTIDYNDCCDHLIRATRNSAAESAVRERFSWLSFHETDWNDYMTALKKIHLKNLSTKGR